MSFDSRSLKRLRELSQKLPKALPTPNVTAPSKAPKDNKRHIVETEMNPQALFHELMEASPDGDIPTHLIERLKEVESLALERKTNGKLNQIDKNNLPEKNHPSFQLRKAKNNSSTQESLNRTKEEENLYASFDRFLLEDEDEI